MNFLVLTPGIYPDRHSGIPKLVYYLARELRRLGHDIHVLTRRYEKTHPAFEEIEGMHVHRLAIPHEATLGHKFWPLITGLKSREGQKKISATGVSIDVVWVHNPWWVFLADPKKFWPQAKVIYDFHSDATTELIFNHQDNFKVRTIGRLYDHMHARALKRADLSVFHSTYTRGLGTNLLGQTQLKKAIIPGAADADIYYPASPDEKLSLKKQLDLPVDKPVFITARGLKKRTGIVELVEAVDLLKKKGISFHLTLIGRGTLQNAVENRIRDYGLQTHIRLLSHVTEEELARHYRASDVFILPTQGAEGFGLATVEALASGLIVLGTDNSATPEILRHYQHNWVIPGTTPAHLALAIENYCKNPEKFLLPTEKIREITQKHFIWPVSAQRFLEAIIKL